MGEPSPPRNTVTGIAQHAKEKLGLGNRKHDAPEKGKAAQRSELKRAEKQEKEEQRQQEKAELEERWQREDEIAQQEEDDETRARYGAKSDIEELPTHPNELSTFEEIMHFPVGTDVAFRARIHTQRRISRMLDFLLFRDQTQSIQGVLSRTTPHMTRWVQRLQPESLVYVTGTLKNPHESVRSATYDNVEVDINSIHLMNPARDLPWDNYEPPESLHTRLQARVLDIRHPSNHAVFRIRSMIVRKFREVLDDKGFMEIQTPKLQPAATESGAEVFKVNYFGRTAFLAQSPQLAKQMTISAGLKKVYEIGPVFRAENSNTHRHLTEYTGLDLEMEIYKDYYELIKVIDLVIKSIISAVQAMPELKVVRERWPSDDFVYVEDTPIIPFTEGLKMLQDDGIDVRAEDLSTRDEIRLGQLVKEKYKTDYFILDKFPAIARPFYTHKADDPKWTNSFDIFLRGQEICTGGQRIHDAKLLRESMKQAKIPESGMEEYLAAFDLGPPPHGGAGLGLERIVMLMLDLGDVRNATLFHRDPKSLPARPPSLPHPEADTTKHWKYTQPPPLEKLIANYGDASNTSWLDDRFEIWRHPNGAAVGYAKQGNKFAMIIGDPLCDQSQYEDVMATFVKFVIHELKLTPVWMLVSEEVQRILAQNHRWRTLSCTEEQRVDPEKHTEPRKHDVRRVEREGISIAEVQPDEDFIRRAEEGIEEWKASRKGRQVHLTEIRPWLDKDHRRYFAAEKEDKVLGLVILAQLAPRHGWQVKWAFDFPNAPNGTIEVLVEKALSSVSGNVTFGAGVSKKLIPGAQLSGVRAKFLSNAYDLVARSLSLDKKAGFREKFGVIGEEVYICYPRYGVAVHDLRHFVKFFQD